MLVYFRYTYCPDVCPTTLNEMAEALDRLGSDAAKVAPLFITVDPKRDMAAVLRDYVEAFDTRIRGLTEARSRSTRSRGSIACSTRRATPKRAQRTT